MVPCVCCIISAPACYTFQVFYTRAHRPPVTYGSLLAPKRNTGKKNGTRTAPADRCTTTKSPSPSAPKRLNQPEPVFRHHAHTLTPRAIGQNPHQFPPPPPAGRRDAHGTLPPKTTRVRARRRPGTTDPTTSRAPRPVLQLLVNRLVVGGGGAVAHE